MGKLRDFLQELPQDERDNVLAPKVVAVKGIFQLAEQDEWPEPEEIRQTTLEPVEPIPPEIIPVWFREWLSDVAYRMQVPLDFVAVGALVAVSSVIGAGCAIRPLAKDNWSEVPNLWGAVVARPSSKKSPALSEVMKPIARLEAAAKELYEAESQLAAAEQEAYKAQKAALASAMAGAAKNSKKVIKSMDDLKWEYAALEEPTVPVRRRYKTNDSTVEKIGELLNQNLRGLLYFRDELVGMLASWEREDRQGDRAFYLECWNGKQPYDTDRIGRGNVFVKNCCLSILGGIQPSKLLAYLIQNTSSLQNDGMVQRFQLLVYPDEVKTWELVDEYQNREALKAVYTIFDRLASMKFTQYGAIQEEDDDRPYFRFNEEAQQIFYEWYRELEARLRTEENAIVCEHIAKYRKLMPSIALIFHLISIAATDSPCGGVTVEAATMAAGWCEYLESHARRVYGMLSKSQEMAVAALARKIQKCELPDGFSVRDVYRKHWSLLDGKETIDAACIELLAANWIKRREIPVAGRQPQIIFNINPKIKKYQKY